MLLRMELVLTLGKYELDSCRDCDNDYGDDTGNCNDNDDTD